MARAFDGSTQYLSNATAPVTAVPLSMAAWIFKTDAAATTTILSIGNSATVAEFALRYNAVEDVLARCESVAEADDSATSLGAGVNNAWVHAAAVFRSATSRDAYRDGGNKGSNTNTNTPLAVSNMAIARQANSDASDFFPGYLADVALWNIALSDSDVAALAKGVSPLHIRPDGLVAYWPLMGRHDPEIDRVGGFNMTLVNAPTFISNHPRLHKLYRKLGLATAFTTADATFSISDSVAAVGVAIHTLMVGKVDSPPSTGVAAASALLGKIAGIDAPGVATSTFSVGMSAATDAVGTAAHTLQVGVVAATNAVGVATATLMAGVSALATAVGTGAHTLAVGIVAAVDAVGVAASSLTSSIVFIKFVGHAGTFLAFPGRWKNKAGWKSKRTTWRPKR